MKNNPSLLFITDLYYQANNREYYKEDLYITSQLKDDFDIIICHPLHSTSFEDLVDLIVVRNSGPTIYYKEYFNRFVERVKKKGTKIFNSLDGSGDMLGKDYLITLTRDGYPVIPTIDNIAEINKLPATGNYIVKPKHGADSIGARRIDGHYLKTVSLAEEIVQPFIDFEYEVSFYYIDGIFQYALYAPDKNERWKLERYIPMDGDLDFAKKFIDWNTLSHGIQRVDACRTKEGALLLVEIEDLNPYLSINLLDSETRALFIANLKRSLTSLVSNDALKTKDCD